MNCRDGYVINMESHGFLCHLGIIAFVIGKIALASLVQLLFLLSMQLLPNRMHPCDYPY